MKKLGTITLGDETLDVFEETYQNNDRLAILVFDKDGSPYCALSVNVIEVSIDHKDDFVLNHDTMSNTAAAFLASGMFEDTDRRVHYGFVRNQPVWRLKRS